MKDDSERSLRHQGAWGDFFNQNDLRRQGLDRRFTNREAANSFLSALDEKQRQSVLFAFEDEPCAFGPSGTVAIVLVEAIRKEGPQPFGTPLDTQLYGVCAI
jgi:hypothetical protein